MPCMEIEGVKLMNTGDLCTLGRKKIYMDDLYNVLNNNKDVTLEVSFVTPFNDRSTNICLVDYIDYFNRGSYDSIMKHMKSRMYNCDKMVNEWLCQCEKNIEENKTSVFILFESQLKCLYNKTQQYSGYIPLVIDGNDLKMIIYRRNECIFNTDNYS